MVNSILHDAIPFGCPLVVNAAESLELLLKLLEFTGATSLTQIELGLDRLPQLLLDFRLRRGILRLSVLRHDRYGFNRQFSLPLPDSGVDLLGVYFNP